MIKANFKVVKDDPHNDDQYLLGFYETEQDARNDMREMPSIYPSWIRTPQELVVKRVHPEMILCPVATDYSHYCRSLIPSDEWKRVMKSDASAEISANNMMCGFGGRTYYNLSKMIPKDWTVIDIGCAYNPQSYFFMYHKRHIAVEMPYCDSDFHFEFFKAPNTELMFKSGQEFIKDVLPTLDLDLEKTFAICNYVPSNECCEMVRKTFKNCFCYYPK